MTEAEMEADAQALARSTARKLPSLEETMRAVPAARQKGALMRRPGLIVLAAAVTALCVVPIPVHRTIGYDVRLTVPETAPAGAIGRELARAVRADGITVAKGVVTARLPAWPRSQVERAAQAFARGLSARGIAAKATVITRTERSFSTALAMAYDGLLRVRVETQGKTDEQIAAEIQSQLDQAGLTSSSVSVRTDAGGRQVDVAADDGDGRQYRLEQRGPAEAPVQMEAGGIDDRREPGMTDAQLKAKIERQLRERGLDPEVSVDGPRIEIRARRSR